MSAMFYFWIVVLLIIAIVFVLWPLYRRQTLRSDRVAAYRATSTSRSATNVTLYQNQLDELIKSRAEKTIDENQYRQLKHELTRNLLNDTEGREERDYKTQVIINSGVSTGVSRATFAGIVLILPVLAVVIYQHIGADGDDWKIAEQLSHKYRLLQDPTTTNPTMLDKLNRELIVILEKSLKNSPGKTQARLLHARIAVELEDFNKAVNSYRQALEQQPQSSEIMAELAQTLLIGAGHKARPMVEILVKQALAVDPDNAMALSLMGMIAFNDKKYDDAITFWQQVLDSIDPNTTDAMILKQGIAQARLAVNHSTVNETAGKIDTRNFSKKN